MFENTRLKIRMKLLNYVVKQYTKNLATVPVELLRNMAVGSAK